MLCTMPPQSSAKLSVAERILRLQAEWDELAADPEGITLTDAQRSELDHRLSDHTAAPDDVVSWSEIKRTVRANP